MELQAFHETAEERLEILHKKNEELKTEIQILRRAVASVPQGGEEHTKTNVDTWENLCDALSDRFLPSNSSWVARDRLNRLK